MDCPLTLTGRSTHNFFFASMRRTCEVVVESGSGDGNCPGGCDRSDGSEGTWAACFSGPALKGVDFPHIPIHARAAGARQIPCELDRLPLLPLAPRLDQARRSYSAGDG